MRLPLPVPLLLNRVPLLLNRAPDFAPAPRPAAHHLLTLAPDVLFPN